MTMNGLNKFTIQKSFAINAGAGSGKTYTLSRRYINALLGFDYFREDYQTQDNCFENLNNAKVNQIVTITYTEAAALEMKGRIFELVSKIINPNLDPDDEDYASIEEANNHICVDEIEYVQETLKQASTDSSNAKISTIHAYCLDIIKANADVAKIDTKLDIIKDDEKAKELSSIIFEVLNAEENKDTVLDISQNISMFFINDLINTYVGSSKFRKDYDSFYKGSIRVDQYKELICELYLFPAIDDEIIDEIRNAKDADIREKWFDEYVENFKKFDAQPWGSFTIETVYKSGAKKGESRLVKLGLGEKTYPYLNDFVATVDKLVEYYSMIDTQKEDFFFDKVEKIKTLLHNIKANYDERLKALGKIDFDTIITKTLEIMPQVKTNFKYIMVDEFQDTNETQFDIVRNSRNADTNLFVVGDSKQSIYSFQGAEIEVFNNAVHNTELFSSIENMSTNYRSDGVVLQSVNKIFDILLQKDENLKLISQNYEAEAQDLDVSKESKRTKGSFKYLMTPQPYGEEVLEIDRIAQFISEIYHGENSDYTHITNLIAKKEKAIAILFDGGDKMLELRVKLQERGISSKISKSDNFYHTKEINDIFNVLKAIDILARNPEELTSSQKYYIVGAMRSNILRVEDNRIKQHLDANSVDDKLLHYVEKFNALTLSQAVKYIYDDSNIMGVYAHLGNVEQRIANLYKFLTLCKEYEEGSESNLYKFLTLIENAIYFSEAKEDEAFFQSDNTKSIELCTIHSTKGLAYPLVLLGNADKGLYSQVTSDALKHNNFTMNGEKKEIVGFKINDYVPLSHRVLKQIDKMKHLAEKKRLLYVALTRSEHDVVISAHLKQKKGGDITLSEDSYLSMIISALEIDVDELYAQNTKYVIKVDENKHFNVDKAPISYVEHTLKPITFESKMSVSATNRGDESTSITIDSEAAKLGTITHKIIELYWNSFNDHQETILDKMGVFDTKQREAIENSMKRFSESDVYTVLQNGNEHHFELEFNDDGKTGFIDFLYFDTMKEGWIIVDFKTGQETEEKNMTYQEQLDFYRTVMETLGYKIVNTTLLWI
ncbi:MAG: AAA family ATPase [Sulfurovum sp.]|nr:AAA family ATPase [Sulfurovum sp.]